MAAGRKTGGRQKGSLNKRSEEFVELAKKKGQTPLEYMLDIMHDMTQEPSVRFEAARSAAPYIHPRLQSTHSTDSKTKSFEDWLSEIDAAEAKE